MNGVELRLVLAGLCAVIAVPLIVVALLRRRRWRNLQERVRAAQVWWEQAHAGPFDQTRPGVPQELEPYVAANGPRTDLITPAPALAALVWGWLLLALGSLVALTALAQASAGLS